VIDTELGLIFGGGPELKAVGTHVRTGFLCDPSTGSSTDQRLDVKLDLGARALEGLLRGVGELREGSQHGRAIRLVRRPVLFAPAPLPLSASQDVPRIDAAAAHAKALRRKSYTM
jgi:hypothetical protein